MHVVRVAGFATVCATRESGQRFRPRIEKLLEETTEPILLDFVGTEYVSSSFVDEVVAGPLLKLGAEKAERLHIRLKSQRLAERLRWVLEVRGLAIEISSIDDLCHLRVFSAAARPTGDTAQNA